MYTTNQSSQNVDEQVERLFKEHPPLPRKGCTNPVTGTSYLGGDDPVEPQKRDARAALLARAHFALNGPADAPPLPLSHAAREDLKIGGLPHLLAWYARSWEGRDYDLVEHPSFDDFARGVMASDELDGGLCEFIKKDEELLKRFPPRHLAGLGPGLRWRPPALHAEVMASYARAHAREVSYRAQSR